MVLHQNDPMIYCAFQSYSVADSSNGMCNTSGQLWFADVIHRDVHKNSIVLQNILGLVGWLPGCRFAQISILMPDYHESLICQLVWSVVSSVDAHLEMSLVGENKINFLMCVVYSTLSFTYLSSKSSKTSLYLNNCTQSILLYYYIN